MHDKRKMEAGGYVTCFMCRMDITTESGDLSNYRRHMKEDHMVSSYINRTSLVDIFSLQILHGVDDYILAGCFMTSEERVAVRDVVIDKIPFMGETAPKAENLPRSVGRSSNRYKCDHCPVSFTIQSNLAEHLERKHRIVVPKEDTESVFVDTKIGLTGTRSNRKSQTKSNSVQKTKISVKSKIDESRISIRRTRPGDPGTGHICRLCSKEFPGNGAMRRHFEDIHDPGEYPCKGCGKMFTSRNKVSSHYSRNCKRKSLYI